MANQYGEIAFTDKVKDIQKSQGSRQSYARQETGEPTNAVLGTQETQFIAARDSFYMASVSETGWPYVQHRGGPAGFVRLLDERTLGFADFRGNRQYVSVGNLTRNDRVSLIFMDYANRARLKLYGRVRFTEDAETLARLALPDYRGRVERAMLIAVEAFDWNCPQHISRRFTEAELAETLVPLQARIAALEAELASAAIAAPAMASLPAQP